MRVLNIEMFLTGAVGCFGMSGGRETILWII